MISTGGIWRAQDLLATLNDRTLRGMALDDIELRYIAPELLTGSHRGRPLRRLHHRPLAYEMATGRRRTTESSMPELLGHDAGRHARRSARARSPNFQNSRRRHPASAVSGACDRFATVRPAASAARGLTCRRRDRELSANDPAATRFAPSAASSSLVRRSQDGINLHVAPRAASGSSSPPGRRPSAAPAGRTPAGRAAGSCGRAWCLRGWGAWRRPICR